MSILVVLEQQGGQWHRMSWETLAAGQQLGAANGQPVEAAVVGKGIGTLANEAATRKLAKVWAVEHDLLDSYTAFLFVQRVVRVFDTGDRRTSTDRRTVWRVLAVSFQ